MKRTLTVAFAVLASILVATAMPAAAANTAVASIHTTDTDFQNGSLTNATVEGVGNSASVKAQIGGVETTRPADDNSGSSSGQFGLQIEPNTDLSGVKLTISSQTSGATTAYLKDSSGTTLDTASITNGAATLSASLTAGSKYNVTVDDSGNSYTVGFYGSPSYPYDGQSLDITAGYQDGNRNFNNAYAITSVAPKFTSETAEYISANHSVSEATEGFTNLTLENATATVIWEGSSGSAWNKVASATYSSSGNKTLSISGTSYDTWRVNVTFQNESGRTTALLHDEGVRFQNSPPAVDNATLDPSDNTRLSDSQQTFSVDVSDPDFPLAQSDTLTADLYVDGSKVGSNTLGSNGTASVTHTISTGGDHTYHWEVSDEYGDTTDSETVTVTVPATLYIRNETNASELVDDPINVTVRFYGSNQIIERETNGGTVSLDGLPVTDFIVEVKATDNYRSRTIYLSSIYQQQSAYLLPNSVSHVQSRFVLSDPTGQYDGESILSIKKPIERNGTTTYRTVVADQFGVEGLTATLQKDTRYKILIQNRDGTQQLIGPYRSDVNETVTVRPGNPTISFGEYQQGWGSNAALTDGTLEFRYSDPDNSTQSVTVWVHEKNNKSNQLRSNTTFYDLGNMSGAYSLTENESETTWVVNFIIEFDDGRTVTTSHTVAMRPDLVPDMSDDWTLIIGVGMLLISAGIFSTLNAAVGGIVVSIEGAVLWWVGFLPGATSGAAVVISLFVCVLFAIYDSNSGGP